MKVCGLTPQFPCGLTPQFPRPGEMVRSVEGLTTKVLNDCLRKNTEFGILKRIAYNEVPPRVQYEFTSFGTKFVRVLDEIENLQNEIASEIDPK